jgi:hypothetical protein
VRTQSRTHRVGLSSRTPVVGRCAARDTAQRGDKTLDQDETLTFKISGGKFTRLEENHSDQAAYDAFWS